MRLIPAEPFDFPLHESATALIIIDMQRDFLLPGGFGAALGNDVSILQAIVPTTQRLLALARARQWLVVHTQECHAPDLSDCPPAKRLRGNPQLRIGDDGPMGRILIAGQPGADFIEALMPITGEVVLRKPGKGAFYATELQAILAARGIRTLVFAGVTTEVCVQTTMREANDRGYESLLIEDATASYFPQFKQATLEMIRAQGAIVGWTTPFEHLAATLG